MVTDSVNATTTVSGGLLARAGARLRRLVCGLHGHDELLHFEQGRISLQCVSCGYQSPGWEIKQPPAATTTTAAPAPRARVLRLPLVNHRRIA